MRVRTVPYALMTKVEEEMDKIIKEGVLPPVRSSDWATPIEPVIKHSDSIHICGDYKTTVNPYLEVEQCTHLRLEDMLTKLVMGEKKSPK